MIIMMIFNMLTSCFHKISFHYFQGLFNDKTDPRVSKVFEERKLILWSLSGHTKMMIMFVGEKIKDS